ncbi:MAG: DUF1127 domain-containing protein [Roseobacter sp.]|nr:DUF1127 domain-containing protein [Roseobacter sp.]
MGPATTARLDTIPNTPKTRDLRKDAQHLHSLPDHLLKDVGICREKIDLEIRRLRRF